VFIRVRVKKLNKKIPKSLYISLVNIVDRGGYKMKVEWIEKYSLWVSDNYLIVPREDEDGIDFFFAVGKIEDEEFKGETLARYCSGEGYWAFYNLTKEQELKFNDVMKEIVSLRWQSEFAEKAKEVLPVKT
jgi:hypothetical protein